MWTCNHIFRGAKQLRLVKKINFHMMHQTPPPSLSFRVLQQIPYGFWAVLKTGIQWPKTGRLGSKGLNVEVPDQWMIAFSFLKWKSNLLERQEPTTFPTQNLRYLLHFPRFVGMKYRNLTAGVWRPHKKVLTTKFDGMICKNIRGSCHPGKHYSLEVLNTFRPTQ